MPHKTHLVIAIPVYNEGKVIKRVINSIPRKIKGVSKISIIAVDDGSTDNSAEEIKKARAILLPHPVNMGAGSATITGLLAGRRLNADIVITLDGDGQHDPKDIEAIIKPIISKKADIVIGTRLRRSAGMPAIKKVGNFILNIITFSLSRTWTSDSQSGFKALSRKAISKIDIDAAGYEFCSEMIIEAKRHHLRITEVPIKVIYSAYSKKKGQSVFNGINIAIRLFFKKLTRSMK